MPKKRGKSIIDNIQAGIDKMYQTTYYSSPKGSKELDDLNSRINSHIDNISVYNLSTTGLPNISKMYSRIRMDSMKGIGNGKTTNDITELFDKAIGFEDFYSNFMSNRYLVEIDAEIDAVCKYFPELIEALDVKKEGVLSADHFSKDWLTVLKPNGVDESVFSERIKELKERYNLLTFFDDVYDQTAKYGEQYIYCVPYSTAISRLLKDKANTMSNVQQGPGDYTMTESSLYGNDINPQPIVETYKFSFNGSKFTITDQYKKNIYANEACVITESNDREAPKAVPILGENNYFDFEVEISTSGVLETAVLQHHAAEERKLKTIKSVTAEHSILQEKKELSIVRKDPKTGKLVIMGQEDRAQDGLINPEEKKDEDYDVKVPGCVLTKVKRSQVIPIYLQGTDKNLGYYYIELRSVEAMQDFQGYNYMMSDSLTSIRGSNSGMNAPFNVVDPTRQEQLLQYLAGQLSQFIDKQFVQSNQDLAEEIYMILKQNDLFNTPSIDKMKVSFIPPEDMIHVYFDLNPDTHRGISDLEKAMIPAKIYACMYITDAIAQMVRGQDRRVFYIRQNVETNISKTLMNTIQQIKQGNFGLRQFSSINNVLNITGKFNDFVIPTSASGESPVQIEVLPGQQFNDNSEKMQQLKEMAINSTDVPFEIIQTRQSVDYAMQLSMSSSRFLRKIYHRQGLYTPFLNRIVTKLYNYQFNEKENLTVSLPPPMFLNMANTNQLVDNIKQFVQSTVEFETNNIEDEKLKNTYMHELFKFYVGTHVDLSKHEALLQQAMMKAKEQSSNEEGQDEGY